MFNADPHPGNYIFGDDHVVFLDFGCVQPVEGEVLACARRMHRAAIDRDETGFRRGCAGMLGTKGGTYEDAVLGYTRRGFAPLFDSPYRIRPEFVADNVREIQGLKKLVLGRDDSVVGMPRSTRSPGPGPSRAAARVSTGRTSTAPSAPTTTALSTLPTGRWSIGNGAATSCGICSDATPCVLP